MFNITSLIRKFEFSWINHWYWYMSVFCLKQFSGPRLERACRSTEPLIIQQLHHRRRRHLCQLCQQQTPRESPRHPHVSNKHLKLPIIVLMNAKASFYFMCYLLFWSGVWPRGPEASLKPKEFKLSVSKHLPRSSVLQRSLHSYQLQRVLFCSWPWPLLSQRRGTSERRISPQGCITFFTLLTGIWPTWEEFLELIQFFVDLAASPVDSKNRKREFVAKNT